MMSLKWFFEKRYGGEQGTIIDQDIIEGSEEKAFTACRTANNILNALDRPGGYFYRPFDEDDILEIK